MSKSIYVLFLMVFIFVSKLSAQNNAELTLCLERIDPITKKVQVVTEKVPTSQVGVVIMDVWDRHWCKSWTAREAAMIPKLNKFLAAARKHGVSVFFSPSSVSDYYKDYSQRKAVLAIPKSNDYICPSASRFYNNAMSADERADFIAKTKPYFKGTIYEARTNTDSTYKGYPPLPPFALTGGCECGPNRPCKPAGVWTRQSKDLIIADNDYIVEGESKEELFNLCKYKGITHLFYIGAAGNMCLTWTRETSFMTMANRGFKPVLIEDLIISISGNGYNPDTDKLDPKFTPQKGDAIVFKHLKTYAAPSTKSKLVFPDMK
jgi:nicotinamidase-related amidase